MMDGLSQFLQGDPNQAAATLESIAQATDDSPATFALLSNVYSQQGKEDILFKRLAVLRDMDRSTFEFEDHLLVGWGDVAVVTQGSRTRS